METKKKTNSKGREKVTLDPEHLELEKKVQEKRKLVDEFLSQLSKEQRDNHHFTANIFAPEDHFLHIQESYGFNEWLKKRSI